MEFQGKRAFAAFDRALAPEAQEQHSWSSTLPSASGLIVPVVLSGGGGSRLWPYSTNENPKQFLPLLGARSMFSETLARVCDELRFAPPVVVASELHGNLCEQELRGQGDAARLILEPCARNTAAAIVMAAAVVREMHGEEALLLVLPSDHFISDVGAFLEAVSIGEPAAREGRLVTFGVKPTRVETGFGYLQPGSAIADRSAVREVSRFVEKPSLELAAQFVAGGDYLWNAGILLVRADVLLDEVIRFAPRIGAPARAAVEAASSQGIRILPEPALLADCPSESIDRAILERSERLAVVPMFTGWLDIGSWDALAAMVRDQAESGPVTALDCTGCYIRSDGLQIAALGVRDLIIVASGQRLLILPKGRSEEVKRLLAAMDTR